MKRTIIILIILFLLALLIFVSMNITSLKHDIINYNHTRTIEAEIMLRKISQKIGTDFNSSLALREYVFCELLKKGMNRTEIYTSLSKIGEIKPIDTQVDFINYYLYYNLSPIMLEFDSPSNDARLINWYASTESNFNAPRASCENNN